MFEILRDLDRRWLFLAMALAVGVPILLQVQFPEKPTALAKDVFDEIERLEEGDKVLLAFDYDPASAGELSPMATAFVRHCCEKKLKMYFLALWPVGPQMIDETVSAVIKADFPHLEYGEDYVNLGFKSGGEGVIKVIVADLRQIYTTDAQGTGIDQIPMCRGVGSIRDMDLLVEISAGYPGTKEWVQYAATPYGLRLVGGCTGVQAPLLYPYIPDQLPGLLGAIKGAAEYEQLVVDRNRKRDPTADDGSPPAAEPSEEVDPKYLEGRRRMGPQLVAHLLMIGLILLGNVVFLVQRSREGRRS
jgi:hypothetical protein